MACESLEKSYMTSKAKIAATTIVTKIVNLTILGATTTTSYKELKAKITTKVTTYAKFKMTTKLFQTVFVHQYQVWFI